MYLSRKIYRDFLIGHLNSLFPSFSSLFESRQSVHLYYQFPKFLVDFFVVKVPNFNPQSPVCYVDSHQLVTEKTVELLSPFGQLTDFTQELDVISCATPLSSHREGLRLYMEEIGNLGYDEELKRYITGYVSFVDPRSRYMGSRIISVEGCVEADNVKDKDYYKMWRIVNGICEGEAAIKSNPLHMNFQYFNRAKKPEASEVYTACGIVKTNSVEKPPITENVKIEDIVDRGYKNVLKSMRLVDKAGNMNGVIYEYMHNLVLAKLHCVPNGPLVLENGDFVDIFQPGYVQGE